MKLAEVTVKNYRSIGTQTRFSVEDLTTLVGPNNEGKSNLLRALGLGMNLIGRWSNLPDRLSNQTELTGRDAVALLRGSRAPISRKSEITHGYIWADDYPLAKQERRGTHPTVIRLKFELDENEVRDFNSATGISNNGELPIEITLGRDSASFGVVKQGPGSVKHRAKATEIANFISERLSFVYIPAVRTVNQARDLVGDLARLRIRELANSEEYQELTRKLNELRQSAVDKVGDSLVKSVKRYLPSVKDIKITTTDFERSNSVEDLLINDGSSTSISNKGDGVKSLITLALIQELARERSKSHSFILAVDEPEAHLHSSAVHELQALFQDLSQSQQVILATHNPIFVNRDRIESNILVIENTASPARSVGNIRSAIGVQLHDNLESAETVVLVEGITDASVLPILMQSVNPKSKTEIQSGRVAFKATKGTGKLRSLIAREKSTICRIIVALDNDQAGRQETDLIRKDSLLNPNSIFMIGDPEKRNSELEDLIEPSVYLEKLSQEFQRSFLESHFKNRSKKWSENLESAAQSLGIALHGNDLIDLAKKIVSEAVKDNPDNSIKASCADTISSFARLVWPK
ncbi:ATP-dependent endonuclease [Nocardiopsis sp. CNS-639]|uniref:ATP-dependent nuclease n=1 Tax=Nocardiopsis sp. CNS-639 TaxID=1169153 RepID=UPI0012DBF4FD|nr:AAA family ATPase [Nocardiopsis sp. CNS-639]